MEFFWFLYSYGVRGGWVRVIFFIILLRGINMKYIFYVYGESVEVYLVKSVNYYLYLVVIIYIYYYYS